MEGKRGRYGHKKTLPGEEGWETHMQKPSLEGLSKQAGLLAHGSFSSFPSGSCRTVAEAQAP